MKTLREIFDKHKCDKGSQRHCYDRVYEPALKHLRDKEFNLFEIGIFKGASLASWADYFPKANLYAIDIFTRVSPESIPILKHPRVSWSEHNSFVKPNNVFNGEKFDVIIDDGLHTHDAQRMTFTNFIPHLKDGGVYFIEDVWAFDRMTPQQKNHRWMVSHQDQYSDEQYNQLLDVLKPYKTIFHDIRKGYPLETFIIEVRGGSHGQP